MLWWMRKIIMLVDHECFKSNKKGQIEHKLKKQGCCYEQHNGHPFKKVPKHLLFALWPLWPLWKIEAPSPPKHNNLFATSSLVSPPHFIKATMIDLVRLDPDPSTIYLTLSKIGTLTQSQPCKHEWKSKNHYQWLYLLHMKLLGTWQIERPWKWPIGLPWT